jgi:hypothetical protein
MAAWADAVDRPDIVDEALDRNDPFAGIAILVLVLNQPDPGRAAPSGDINR